MSDTRGAAAPNVHGGAANRVSTTGNRFEEVATAMGAQISSVMTPNPVCVPRDASLSATAAIMRDSDIGAVVVMDDGRITGIATDRDLVVRGLADGADPVQTPVATVASPSAVALSADSSTADAVRQMRESSVRRLPVCDTAGNPIGIVSLGDLAEEMDPESALADISSATPNV